MISSDMREYVSGGGYERDQLRNKILAKLKELEERYDEPKFNYRELEMIWKITKIVKEA